MADCIPSEPKARALLIDSQLEKADWKLGNRTQVLREIPVTGYDAEPADGVTDYTLYHPGGSVLAVVEARKFSRDPRGADKQLRHYLTEIAQRQAYAPFGFMADGREIWF